VTRSDILALAFRELIERLAGEFSACERVTAQPATTT
jgi:hypothetical protein